MTSEVLDENLEIIITLSCLVIACIHVLIILLFSVYLMICTCWYYYPMFWRSSHLLLFLPSLWWRRWYHSLVRSLTQWWCWGRQDDDGNIPALSPTMISGRTKFIYRLNDEYKQGGGHEEEVCCVCLVSAPSTLLQPCKHGALCFPCCSRVFSSLHSICPLCRASVDTVFFWHNNKDT